MIKYVFQIIFLLLFIFVPQLHAECYYGIMPLDSFGDVKGKFPNAKVEKLSPAWAQDTDALYTFRGIGITGTIVVKFYDIRPTWGKLAEEYPDTTNTEFYLKMAQQSDEEAMSVEWVRWIPNVRIPLQRIIAKYGKPEKRGFSDEGYEPYRAWPKKGIEAYLTGDEKYVLRVDYIFTKEEYHKSSLKKYGYIPEWLKDKKPSVKKKK